MAERRKYEPQGDTPGKPPSKKTNQCAHATASSRTFKLNKNTWTIQEDKDMIKYFLLKHGANDWPADTGIEFWNRVKDFLNKRHQNNRSGQACRRHTERLKDKYGTIDLAKKSLQVSTLHAEVIADTFEDETSSVSSEHLSAMIKSKNPEEIMDILQVGFKELALKENVNVEPDFLCKSLEAMRILQESECYNSLYNMATAIVSGNLPLKRMPYPLIEANLSHFARQKVVIREEYRSWLESMYAHFGEKFISLFRGPHLKWDDMSSSCAQNTKKCETAADEQADKDDDDEDDENDDDDDDDEEDDEDDEDDDAAAAAYDGDVARYTSTPVKRSTLWKSKLSLEEQWLKEHGESAPQMSTKVTASLHRKPGRTDAQQHQKRSPENAKVNIIGLSSRRLRHHIGKSDFNTGSDIQVSMLKAAHDSNPKGRWWLKADACDLNSGIRESVTHEWSGDVDMGNGELKKKHDKYMERLEKIDKLSLEDMPEELDKLKMDVCVLKPELAKAKADLDKKEKQEGTSKAKLLELLWNKCEYERLLKANEKLQESMKKISESGTISLNTIKTDLKEYTQGITAKQRVAATHLLIFMISEESRNAKPYALPVSFMMVRTVTDTKIRELKDELKDEMTRLGMTVVGFVTDGEWNSLRSQGTKRPVQLIQLIRQSKEEALKIKADEMRALFEPNLSVISGEGTREFRFNITHSHPALPVEVVGQIAYKCQVKGMSKIEVIHKHHCELYKHLGHEPEPWTPGTSEETPLECMRSVLATYILRKKVEDYKAEGVDFSKHLYVPEMQPNGIPLFSREDEGHLLKRVTKCVRCGAVHGCDMSRWIDGLNDESTGLTLGIVKGARKQSVPDCESMFSPGVIRFMERHGHTSEAKCATIIHNWHKATDGRGLSAEQRAQYNKDMLDFILDDWMPWHRHIQDYSLVDINRPIKGIRGFTREVIIGIIANIESQLMRHEMSITQNLDPEHPRAGTSDDVESFISLLHHMLGPIFDHKTFRGSIKKVLHEYTKMISADSPFYYYTGINERFATGPLPSFNQPSGSEERLDRTRKKRFGNPASSITARAARPVAGERTFRDKYHKVKDPMPEVPK